MAVTSIYALIVRDNVPEVISLQAQDSATIGTVEYWLIPKEIPVARDHNYDFENKALFSAPFEAGHEEIRRLYNQGITSAEEIGRRVSTSGATVRKVLHDMGLKTPADKLRIEIRNALRKAGPLGVTPHQVASLAPPTQRVGPILTDMKKKGEITRLQNRNWIFANYDTTEVEAVE